MNHSLKGAFALLFSLFVIIILTSCQPDNSAKSDVRSGFDNSYETLIDSIVKLLTLEEKVYMIHGNGMFTSGGVERLGLPGLSYTDGPTGIREELEPKSWEPMNWTTDSVTFFPTGTALAATWNAELALRYGIAIGSEARAREKDVLLGPGVNIIRTPLCGRNFEYFSEDPYLASVMTVGYVRGVQMQDVAACVKHYALNNQEYMRGWINVEVDERTLREIYLPVYKAAVVEGGAYSFMGSYNKFRGDYVCENDYLQNKILKEEWGFKGIIVSDWGATHSTVKAAINGLDVEMGNAWKKNEHYMATLADSVRAGLVSVQVLDDKVRRILRVIYNCKVTDPARSRGSMNTPENSMLAFDVASESIVLLKNDKGLLPLDMKKISRLAVIGMMADQTNAMGGFTAGVKAKYEITPLAGLKRRIGDTIPILFTAGYREDFVVADTGGLWPYRYPNPTPDDSLIAEAVRLARDADQVLLFTGNPRTVETEAADRETLSLPFGQDSLIRAVTAVNPNTVIVVVAGAACDLNTADDKASAIVYSWYNGSESGNALASILFGDINPSGKLPFTIPEKLEDIGAHALKAYPGNGITVEYSEGILVGYRWFDTKNIEPAWCFGHGLSYTDFEISDVSTDKKTYTPAESLRLSFALKNTGDMQGKETVQVYIRKPESEVERADRELKAFSKIGLDMGQKEKISLEIPLEKLACFNTEKMQWVVEPGEYELLVGSSSRDIAGAVNFNVSSK